VEGGTVLKRALIALAAVAAVALPSAAAAPQKAVPHRIISLSPTATESLFAIGAGKQVIAVDDQSDYPKQAPRTKLSGYTPNVEAIAKYRPDLVVISGDVKGLRSSLTKLHIPVLLQPAATTLAGTYAQIRELGARTGHIPQARALVKRMQQRIKAAVASAPHEPLKVFHELSPDLYSAKSATFIGRVYELFGLKNIADDAPGTDYPQLSSEYVVAANPDVIVLADSRCCGQSRATVSARPGWSGVSAVKTGTIVRIDDSIASRWGPRVVDYVRAMASALNSLKAK
jgi:iron complex transport system substrate-binding protein